MLVLTLAAALSYAFPSGSKSIYDLTVNLDGYVPILGRTQATLEIKMAIEAAGNGQDADGNWKVTSDILEMKAVLSGVPLPFTVQNVKTYFPKANLIVTPAGKTLKTDAPDVPMPIRLPGLDARRLPDISFLPLEFPASEVEPGKPWTFKKTFSGSEFEYTATFAPSDDGLEHYDVKVAQRSATFEDASGGLVKEEAGAVVRVAMVLEGTGRIVFDRKLGAAKSVEVDTIATSKVTNLKTSEITERVLKTKLRVLRRAGI